jgi:peptidoglycan/xylan/chitin deacetylase (PgdA/CDA1 family)
MKDLAKRAVLRSGLLRMAGGWRGRGAAILMYHSVMEDSRSQETFLGGIIHSRDTFRGQMELLARRYRPVSLDQINRFVRGEGKLPERAVVITFDDGYTDNYEIAAPVLNEVGVPATFYATVECVERGYLPWPAQLRFIFRTAKKASWADSAGKPWPLSGGVEREKAFLLSCDECCKLAGTAQEEYVARLEDDLGAHVPVESGALMMNYDQMRALAQQGHSVGSHSMTHPNMAHLSLEDVVREMTESKWRLDNGRASVEPGMCVRWTCGLTLRRRTQAEQ